MTLPSGEGETTELFLLSKIMPLALSYSRPTKLLSLVADREAESVQKWLAKHPEVEIVSRDRGGCYVDVRIVDTVRRFGREVSP